MYHLNPRVHLLRRDGVVALYNSVTLETAFLLDSELAEALNHPSTELLNLGFFLPNARGDANAASAELVAMNSDSNDISVAYFLVSDACNFACSYCHIENRLQDTSKSLMSTETAERGIRLFARHSSKGRVIFFGGEPLLNFSAIKTVVEVAKGLRLELSYVVITNGSLLTSEIIEYAKEHSIGFSVSLDGEEETNNKSRVSATGEGTFTKALNAIRMLKNAGLDPGISCTLGPHNYKKTDEILGILIREGVSGFGFNLLLENGIVSLSDLERDEMISNAMRTALKALKYGIVEDRFVNRRLNPFLEGRNWSKDCAGYGHQMVIGPNGKVGVCQGLWPEYARGGKQHFFDIDVNYQGDVREHAIWKEWSRRAPTNIAECAGCIAIGLCGGGCAKNSIVKVGNIWALDQDGCRASRACIPWAIWTYYDYIGNNRNAHEPWFDNIRTEAPRNQLNCTEDRKDQPEC